MKKILIFILSLSMITQSLAHEHALRVLEVTESVLAKKENAISLEEAKEMVAGDNLDIQIAYERLFQAQRRIGQARAQYFPYGVGDVAFIYFASAFSTFIMVELITSLPSKWYTVKKTKHLRNAERHNLNALRENIKNEVAILYYDLLKQEAMEKLTAFELKLMDEMMVGLQAQIALGQSNHTELANLEYRILNLRDEYLKFVTYHAEVKAAFKMLINVPANYTLELQPNSNFFQTSDIAINLEDIAQRAKTNAHEVKAAQEVINAAYDSKHATGWSILSFSGIGFGYAGKLRIERSMVNEAIIRKQAISENIYSNVFTKARMLENSIAFYETEKEIMETTKFYMMQVQENFTVGNVAIVELIETQLVYMRDFREMLMAHYNALTRLSDLERVTQQNLNLETEQNRIK
jgi:hypothetical protein